MSRLFSRPNCDLCEKLHNSRRKDPPCDTCTPELWPENRDIVDVYILCCNQVIIAPLGGVVDINLLSVDKAVERLEKPDEVFQDVVSLARYFIKEDKKNNGV